MLLDVDYHNREEYDRNMMTSIDGNYLTGKEGGGGWMEIIDMNYRKGKEDEVKKIEYLDAEYPTGMDDDGKKTEAFTLHKHASRECPLKDCKQVDTGNSIVVCNTRMREPIRRFKRLSAKLNKCLKSRSDGRLIWNSS